MIEEEKEKQKFKESTLEIIKNLEAEPKPNDERIKWLHRLIENDLPL